MSTAAMICGILFCLAVVLDAFQTIILPRRPSGRFRITRLFYIVTWTPWVALGDRISNRKAREQWFSVFGPVSLIFLLVVWAMMLTAGFGMIYFGIGSPFHDGLAAASKLRELHLFRTDLYVSGTTLFTLGLGDVTPESHVARALLVLEAGTGLGFVALVIGYLPVIYQAFSRREVSVAMLDGRAGSPPTSTELLRRHLFDGGQAELITLLAEWERWSAEILESHISYPILCYYRSQHDNQSWLSALIAVLDACALIITTVEGPAVRQAQLTFAMARHAVIDLGHVFHVEQRDMTEPVERDQRLPAETFNRLCDALGAMETRLCVDIGSMRRLTGIRELYEPHAQALAGYLRMPLPLWVPEDKPTDPWKKVSSLRMSLERKTGEHQTEDVGTGDVVEAVSHVSERSAAANLHDEEHGF